MKLPAAPREWDILPLSEGDFLRGERLHIPHHELTTTTTTSVAQEVLHQLHPPRVPYTTEGQHAVPMEMAIERFDSNTGTTYQPDSGTHPSTQGHPSTRFYGARVNEITLTTPQQYDDFVVADTRPYYVISKFLKDMANPIPTTSPNIFPAAFEIPQSAFAMEIQGVEYDVHPRLSNALRRCRKMGWSDTKFRAMAQALAGKLLAMEFKLRTAEDTGSAGMGGDEAGEQTEQLVEEFQQLQVSDGGARRWDDTYDAFERDVLE